VESSLRRDVAVIGGTGLEKLPADYTVKRETIETRFGRAVIVRAQKEDADFLFLSRHGEAHGIPPHEINYRANIAALVDLGVRKVLATNAVGSLRLDVPPGSYVLLDDFIDFTRARPLSFLEGGEGVVHTDFSEPYCPALGHTLREVAVELGIELLPRGTYLCAEGPRFESPAEIRMFQQWGADVVGMTGLPEATFAREAGLCYAAVAIVTNFGAGLTEEPVEHEEVVARMATQVEEVRRLLLAAARREVEHACSCAGNSANAA
jgi:5'-methylthioadenosine phosphorylase